VEALGKLVQALPGDLAAAVFVVLHVPSTGTSVLPSILSRAGALPAAHASDGDPIEHGRISVAPPDCHLLLEPDGVRVVRGPRENGHRPAIDPLFRSAARAFGRRVAGVILSGVLDDGTDGLRTIKLRGGVAVVQDPDDALYPAMPRSAIAHTRPDHVLPVAALASALVDLTHRLSDNDGRPEVGAMEPEDGSRGQLVPFVCPECGGTLAEADDGGVARYACHVGHAFSVDSLLALQSDALETALWTAMRALEERSMITRRVASRLSSQNRGSARRFERLAGESDEQAQLLRAVLENLESMPAAGRAADEALGV
jgi:two-component system chemotaxis response regulator CheB